MGQHTPQVCQGVDHMAAIETVTCTGDPTQLDELRICAGTDSRFGADSISVVAQDDKWMTELRPFEARALAEALLRQVALVEGESGTR